MKLLRSKLAGTVIGALMLLVGLFALAHVLKITIDEKQLKDWVPHVAQIRSAALSTHENEKGVEFHSIDVSYSFEWEEDSFTGTRYRLHDKANPSAEANREIVEDLLLSKQEDEPYPIFVNPKNPRQSAVINTVHPKVKSSSLFIGLLFSTLGFFTTFKPKLFGKKSASNKEINLSDR